MKKKLPERAIEAPTSEKSIVGAEIGFTESLKTNVDFIKHYLTGSQLKVLSYEIGEIAKTSVSLLYVEDIVDQKSLNIILEKMDGLQVDYLLHPQLIADELQQRRAGLFPTVKLTERFDVAVSDLLQGKVLIIADHTPIGLIAPVLFWGFFQSQDEYFQREGRFVNRILRMICFMVTMYLPAVYLILTKNNHHNGLFSPILEMLFVLVIFKIVSDSTPRIYQPLAFFTNLLAVIILGEMSVVTKLLTPATIAAGAVTQLCLFLTFIKGLIPLAVTMRVILLIVGTHFGFPGLIIVTMIMIVWGAALKPFGIPYLSPVIPFKWREMKDVFIRGKLKRIINSPHKLRK